MKNISRIDMENGFYLFKLRNVLSNKNISINKIMRETNTDFKVIKRLMTGELLKIDIIVLARICNYLNCNIEDLIEYKQTKAISN